MTRIWGGGQKTPIEGAQTIVKLAIKDIQGQTGGFWENEELATW